VSCLLTSRRNKDGTDAERRVVAGIQEGHMCGSDALYKCDVQRIITGLTQTFVLCCRHYTRRNVEYTWIVLVT